MGLIQNVVINSCNNNISQSYYICDPCKITEGEYRAYKTISKVFILVTLIAIFYKIKMEWIGKVSILII